MAAKSLGDFIEIYKREHGCNPGIIETWYAAIEFVEANKPPHDKQSTPCTCANSCVATIYVCKDCGGIVNSK